MGFFKAIGFCDGCGRDAVFTRYVFPVWVHVPMAVFTAGGWLLVLLAAGFHPHRWTCRTCGRRISERRAQFTCLGPLYAFPSGSGSPKPRINDLLVSNNLIYYLPTNATFR
jgi:hypothetical protein